jgi:hypothetical protein
VREPRELPILFTGPNVLAILEDRKTQTRRVAKQWLHADGEWPFAVCPARESGWIGWYGVPDPNIEEFTKKAYTHGQQSPIQVGDRLWVRETWAVGKCADGFKPSQLAPRVWKVDNGGIWLPADGTEPKTPISPRGKTRPGIFMPRWASRLTLEVTAVRAERLQDISEEDARAEGVPWVTGHGHITPFELQCDPGYSMYLNCREGFEVLWSTIHKPDGPHGWNKNPWVWAYTFRRI